MPSRPESGLANGTGDVVVGAVDLTRIFDADPGEASAGVVRAVDGVSVEIRAGEFVAVQGPSGCGKSTLLHLFGGLDLPTSGIVHFDGIDIATLDDDERSALRRKYMGIVSPVVDLIPTLTAWENVAVPLLLAGGRVGSGRERAHELLDQVGLASRAGHEAGRLSTGEAQRVTLARALFNDPTLILADEPTSYLDSVRSDEVVALLRRLADDGGTIVMATHDPRAAAYADRSIRLLDGRLVGDGTGREQTRSSTISQGGGIVGSG